MVAAVAVVRPDFELRFTRARQAVGFWVAAAVLAAAGGIFLLLAPHRAAHPDLPSPAWGLALFAGAWAAARTAVRCTRHAYLILTPLGIEIFPFFRPAAGMQFVPWGDVALAEVGNPPTRLTLHFNAKRSAGIHVSLAPVSKPRRTLLARAIDGVMRQRVQAGDTAAGAPENHSLTNTDP